MERVDGRQRGPAGSAEEGDSDVRPSRFRYIYLIWKNPWMTVGPRTYVADLLRVVGGRSALSFEESSDAVPGDYPATSEDEIVKSRPDVLLLPDEPYPFREKDASYWRSRLPATCRVFPVSGDDFCWHGVRTLQGIEAARRLAMAFP